MLVVPTDVTQPDDVERLAEAAIARFGRIDTWVNGAAVGTYAPFLEDAIADMRQVMEVVYWGQVHGLRTALAHMKADGGTIICIGSLLSDFGVPLMSSYVAAKFALKGLVESVRAEIIHDRLPVDLVLLKPPSVNTPFYRHGRTRLGVEPKPMPPVYEPIVIAREIVRNATHPRREVAIGGLGRAASWLHGLAPGFFEHQLAWYAYRTLPSDEPKSVDAPDNLYGPVAEIPEVRDRHNGKKVSWMMWAESHPKSALGGLAVAAGATAWLATRGRLAHPIRRGPWPSGPRRPIARAWPSGGPSGR